METKVSISEVPMAEKLKVENHISGCKTHFDVDVTIE